MFTTWMVQTNVEPESPTPMALRRSCLAARRPFQEISVVPGSPSLPSLPEIDGPFVFHGRTTLILRAFEHPRWREGVFFDPTQFHHRAYVGGYGDRLLNADARVMSWAELIGLRHDPQAFIFLKPNDDLKQFTGKVIRFSDCEKLYQTLLGATVPVKSSSEIVLSVPREIDAEWRLFIVDGKVVPGSMYRPSGDTYVPLEVIEFAESSLKLWVPASVFVLDVARVDGTYKIVECNCFNGSRFYLADVERLVRTISEFQEQRMDLRRCGR